MILYLAAPLAGEVLANTLRARDALRRLLMADVHVIAPWLTEIDVLRVLTADQEREGRAKAMRRNVAIAARCDGVIALCPWREHTLGMQAEIDACLAGGERRWVFEWDGEQLHELVRRIREIEGMQDATAGPW